MDKSRIEIEVYGLDGLLELIDETEKQLAILRKLAVELEAKSLYVKAKINQPEAGTNG
jgi:hypothetical protein